jgi:hypothetical protein
LVVSSSARRRSAPYGDRWAFREIHGFPEERRNSDEDVEIDEIKGLRAGCDRRLVLPGCACKAIETVTKNKELLEKFVRIAEAAYAVGKGILQDVLKAQVEVSKMIDRLTVLEKKEFYQKRRPALAEASASAELERQRMENLIRAELRSAC